jgi:hypothetical protein
MASEIKVDSIVNSGGDEDSGFDLSTNDVVKVKTANSERMRVDANGNILFNKTALNNTDTGARFNATGDASFVKSGGTCLKLNRTSSHGGVIEILKDNTAVGQLDSSSGNLLIRTNGDKSGIRFDTNGLTAFKNGSEANGTVDLGYSSGRFRDLYLSSKVKFASGGGIEFGHGVSSTSGVSVDTTTLSEYEEGTWTPVATDSDVTLATAEGSYTRIGRNVNVIAIIAFPTTSDGNAATIGNFPYTCQNGNKFRGAMSFAFNNKGDNNFTLLMSANTDTAQFHTLSGGGVPHSSLSGKTFIFSGFYPTAS